MVRPKQLGQPKMGHRFSIIHLRTLVKSCPPWAWQFPRSSLHQKPQPSAPPVPSSLSELAPRRRCPVLDLLPPLLSHRGSVCRMKFRYHRSVSHPATPNQPATRRSQRLPPARDQPRIKPPPKPRNVSLHLRRHPSTASRTTSHTSNQERRSKSTNRSITMRKSTRSPEASSSNPQ